MKEKLFDIDSNRWWENAMGVDKSPLLVIADGYKLLADLGAEYVINTGVDQDYLVFPIVFTYRHYIEIQMKGLLHQLYTLMGVQKIVFGHDLKEISDELVKAYEKYYGNSFDEEVKKYIQEFHSCDESSEAYRYDTRKNGKKIKRNTSHIGIGKFRKIMDKISNYLEAIEAQNDNEFENIQESKHYYRMEEQYL